MPKTDDHEVSFALFDKHNKENVEPSEMIVENLSADEHVPSDDSEAAENRNADSTVSNHDTDTDDSTYFARFLL